MKYLLKNAVILDVAHEYEQADILVDGEKIAAVGQNLSAEDAQVIDMQGKTIMPAFIDAHVHTKPFMGPFDNEQPILKAMVYNGISAVKDLGILDTIPLEGYLEWLAQQDEPGKPRIATAGRYIDVAGGYGCGPVPGQTWGIIIETPEEAADQVTYQYRAGVNGIKVGISDGAMGPVMGKLSGAHIKAITDRAKKYGIWTTAHVYTVDDLRMLVENGIGEAAHTCNNAIIDDDIIAMMVEKGISMTTTVGHFDPENFDRGHVPPFVTDIDAFIETQIRKEETTLANLKKFYEAGGTINVGTDFMRCQDPMKDATIPVVELRQLRHKVGMTMMDVIKAGTVNAAASCGFTDEGAIRPGNRANIIAFTGELDEQFDKLLNLEFVMNRGVVIR